MNQKNKNRCAALQDIAEDIEKDDQKHQNVKAQSYKAEDVENQQPNYEIEAMSCEEITKVIE